VLPNLFRQPIISRCIRSTSPALILLLRQITEGSRFFEHVRAILRFSRRRRSRCPGRALDRRAVGSVLRGRPCRELSLALCPGCEGFWGGWLGLRPSRCGSDIPPGPFLLQLLPAYIGGGLIPPRPKALPR